ncbi:histidine kinase [Phycicoccus duodecadis]|uniref:histidine kinase n=1 Tax=Phycicoccus duodecadis TaxID=173053 RepID=UPI001304043A|nr:histidine kinase [Phycicoccus duodecadis]
MRTSLVVYAAVIWVTAAALVVLDRAVGPLPSVRACIALLVGGGLVYAAAFGLVRVGRVRTAALLALVGTWVMAVGFVWVAPYTTPISILVLHVPSLLITGAFSLRARGGILLTTVALTGLLVGLGEARREGSAVEVALMPYLPLLTAAFTTVVAVLLVVGIRDHMQRLARRTADLRASQRRLALVSLETRREIERDLHDGAQQRLTTLAVDLGRVQRLWDDDPERARAIVAGMSAQLQEAIQELRDLAHGIYPALLGEQGLAGALPAVARRTTLPCVVDLRLARRHSPTVEGAVYFCCLEAVHNADRHSGGGRVTVEVRDDDGPSGADLWFRVHDDGAGFLVGERGSSHGLTGMRDRIQSAGGELEVESSPGSGTSVVGRFRADREADAAPPG